MRLVESTWQIDIDDMNSKEIDKEDKIVLGRTLSHDNSACIIRNGEIVCAIATERLSRIKHDYANNDLAIQYCLDATGIELDDVDVIVQNTPKHYFRAGSESDLIRDDDHRLWTISHHLAHAWGAFATSPFESAVVVVIDGRGNFVPPGRDVVLPPGSERDVAFHVNNGRDWSIEVESIYYATDRQIDLLYRNQNRGIPASIGSSFSRRPGLYPGEYSGYYQFAGLGAMYEQATYGIFGNSLDGGKVMGLSAFSKSNNKQVAQIIQTNCSDDPYRLGTQWLFDQKGAVSVNSDFELAASISSNVQESLELGVNKVMELARRLSGEQHLCYSGGVALNGCANEKVIRSGIFKEVYIQPACNDAGTSIGCAFFGYAHVLGEKLKHGRHLDFTGKSYDDEIEESVIRWQSSIKASRVDELVRSACNLLCSGQIIGWCRGASEFGPRALGHRSILSLPHPISVKDKINNSIKRREGFRPFAPIVPLEDAKRYFDIEGESPYMLRIVDVRPQYRSSLSAITHVDGTARVQTVKQEDDPVLHHLLCAVGRINGIPVLLNTSFNMAGFPMVETPDDAIECFITSNLDSLFINDWLLERRFQTTESLRAQKNTIWILAPGVEIFRRYVFSKDEAWLQHGHRRRNISIEDAEFLSELKSFTTAKEQESVHANLNSGRRLIETLLNEGWIYGASN